MSNSSQSASERPVTEVSLSDIDTLARLYASSYASPNHITFTVNGLRELLAALTERSAEPTRAGTERHTRNEPDPESGIRISPGSSIPVERGMV